MTHAPKKAVARHNSCITVHNMLTTAHTNNDQAYQRDEAPRESHIRELAPRPKKKAKRSQWATKNKTFTLEMQGRIVGALAALPRGASLRELAAELGVTLKGRPVSRQLAMYHVKKAVAAGLIALVLEPCARNGQLQYRAWDRGAMARHYARTLTLAERIDLQAAAA
jgi:hypothetical protein